MNAPECDASHFWSLSSRHQLDKPRSNFISLETSEFHFLTLAGSRELTRNLRDSLDTHTLTSEIPLLRVTKNIMMFTAHLLCIIYVKECPSSTQPVAPGSGQRQCHVCRIAYTRHGPAYVAAASILIGFIDSTLIVLVALRVDKR